MERTIRSLAGEGWLIREALGETWRWHLKGDGAGDGGDVPPAGWWPATVPGSAVTDLWHAGELPDPYHGRNSRAAEWTGSRSWIYRRAVELPELPEDAWATVELDGVDPSGSVYWDGRLLGTIAGLYRPGRFPVPADLANPGRHRLAVVVDPVPASQPQVGRTDLVRTHRPRMNEGWDFCPRLPHQGIWRGARLVLGAVQVADLSVRTDIDAAGDGLVALTATLDVADDRPLPVGLRLLDAAGQVVAERRTVLHGGRSRRTRLDLRVPRPRRWWPRGLGEPVTYRAELRTAGSDEPAACRTVGFRTAELVANPGAPASALPYTALVNGITVPLLGWNWVPADAQYGSVDPRRVRHLVDLAAASGARVLRVWGGGLVETEEFYTACDEAGLLVWQEFSQSSSGMNSAPAADPEFASLLRQEAAAVVPARAHHPALLLWCGGNELDDGAPLDELRSPALAALRDSVAGLDPGRAWLPTSPSGPTAQHRLDLIGAEGIDQHDVHGPWEHQGPREHHTLYNAGTSLAHTEFGVEGMTNPRALAALVPTAQAWPADRTNPVYQHLGDWWNNAPLVRRSFRERVTDLDSLRRASQWMQATGLGYAVEADRRRFPRCSMVVPWQLNESYPNAWCTSSVDHAGEPKPAYHAVARAFAARRVSVLVPTSVWAGEPELTAQGWLWSTPAVPPGSRVEARLRSADGAVLAEAEWPVTAAVSDPRPAGTLTVPARAVPADAVVLWALTWRSATGVVLDREIVVACTGADFAPLLDLGRAVLDITVRKAGADAVTVHVAHRSGPAVVGLRLLDDRPPEATGWLVLSGDPRPLLPGARRAFTVRARHSSTMPRVRLESWNSEPVSLDLDLDLAPDQDPDQDPALDKEPQPR